MPSHGNKKNKKLFKNKSGGAASEVASSCLPVPMIDDVARHIEALVAELKAPVEIRQITPDKGKGAFAIADICRGTVLWKEAPLVAPLQHLANQKMTTTCARCCRWLGDTADVVAGLEAERTAEGKIVEGKGPACSETFVPCSELCGAYYCSVHCRDTDWVNQHRLLCTGCGGLRPEEMSEGHALHRGSLLMFEQHAAECNEALLLAARVIATILSEWERDGRTKTALVNGKAPFSIFQSPPWWDVAARKASSAKDAAEERANMEDELRKSLKYLGLALLPCHRRLCDEIFSLDFYARTIGMFECNNISVEIDCPLSKLASGNAAAVDELAKLDPALRAKIESMSSCLDKNCFKGTGLFPLVSTLNHSCEPNCTVEYDGEAVAHVCAMREISAGEELCISYIDTECEVEERNALLCEYGFECDCPRCVKARVVSGSFGVVST